ncbi:hypothetical protein G210_3406 [Candida maltosa Xu316]|uniref:Extracellular membrane protein CFEM domain-containing protein n=1 Tax=Candida maltosa (strain Xu316) TaxID=1245528 RepID=M3JTZ8_CANMX|nr:hypothetical protein G210_3406 [Candida maltosa Xu316]
MFPIFIIVLLELVIATPPACFLTCTYEIAQNCPNSFNDLTCICINEDSIIGCLVDICPFGAFLSARDHYIGTCLEHGRPTITNPFPPPAIWPPDDQPDESQFENDNPQQQQGTTLRTSIVTPTPTVELPARFRITPIPENDRVHDEGEESEDELYNPNAVCEWEERDALDENGEFIVIRRPINVPKKYRNPANVGHTRRVLIKRPTNQYTHQKSTDNPPRIQHVRKIKIDTSNSTTVASASKNKKQNRKKVPNIKSTNYDDDDDDKKKIRVNRKSL